MPDDEQPQQQPTVVETPDHWMIRCSACGHHMIPKIKRPAKTWTHVGGLVRPTFTPSVNEVVNPKDHKDHNPRVPTRRCHFVITDGRISYMGDCSHELKNTTRELEPWPAAEVKYYGLIMAEYRELQRQRASQDQASQDQKL